MTKKEMEKFAKRNHRVDQNQLKEVQREIKKLEKAGIKKPNYDITPPFSCKLNFPKGKSD